MVEKTLKHGAWGQTYLATSDLGHKVVIKQLLESARLEHSAVERFKQEVRFMASLPDPNIVALITADLEDPSPWYVMEYAKDGTSQGWLEKNHPAARAPGATIWLLNVFTQIARALRSAHEHNPAIIHRDVKPANILLWCSSIVAKLADFGLATEMAPGPVNFTRSLDATPGTINYMSPEQKQEGKNNLTPATDIYSLGVVMYECMTAQTPIFGEDPIHSTECIKALGTEACSSFAQLHKSIMLRNPTSRPSADAVVAALMECQQAYWRNTKADAPSPQQSAGAGSAAEPEWRFELEPNAGVGAHTWNETKDKRANIWRGIGFMKNPRWFHFSRSG